MFAAKGRPPQDAAVSSRPGALAAPAGLLPTSDRSSPNCTCPQEPRRRRARNLRTLFLAQIFQRPYFHLLVHSFNKERNVTPAFPVTSPLFGRSLALERKSTPLFSCACARFCRYVGVGRASIMLRFADPCPGPRVWALLGARENIGNNSRGMNTYTRLSANPCRMSTYKIVALKASCNEHLQKNGGRGSLIVTQPRTGNSRIRLRQSLQPTQRTGGGRAGRLQDFAAAGGAIYTGRTSADG